MCGAVALLWLKVYTFFILRVIARLWFNNSADYEVYSFLQMICRTRTGCIPVKLTSKILHTATYDSLISSTQYKKHMKTDIHNNYKLDFYKLW